jgi:hypothetical protein
VKGTPPSGDDVSHVVDGVVETFLLVRGTGLLGEAELSPGAGIAHSDREAQLAHIESTAAHADATTDQRV